MLNGIDSVIVSIDCVTGELNTQRVVVVVLLQTRVYMYERVIIEGHTVCTRPSHTLFYIMSYDSLYVHSQLDKHAN